MKGVKKARKPRGRKLDGTMSVDFCPGCGMPGCDPFGGSRAWQAKKDRRRAAGKCVACGHNPCRCKSAL